MYGLIKLHRHLEGRLSLDISNAVKLAHVRAVIEIVSPGFDVSSIRPKKPYAANAWFKRGEVFLIALDVLREAEKPLRLVEISVRMLAKRGINNPTEPQRRMVINAIKNTLYRYKGKAVIRLGIAKPYRWCVGR
jgi:hypothetical protein